MANIDDYNAKIGEILAIPNKDAVEPTIPVDVYLQESENLGKWSMMDLVPLAAVGITEVKIGDMAVRAGALREAQSVWFKDRNAQLDAQREWGIQAPLAFDLRDELVHTFRYAFRNDASLTARVAAIADGNTNSDMIQDLNDLSVLGKNNTALLQNIGFDLSKLDMAAEKSAAMAELLAAANGDKSVQSETKMIRDKAFVYLKQMVDEIRDAGKYVFWKNEKRLKGYRSEYLRQKNNDANSGEEKPGTDNQVD
ncbi:MAG: hypothetical protein AB7S72_09555 [Draconibacterium sp.]